MTPYFHSAHCAANAMVVAAVLTLVAACATNPGMSGPLVIQEQGSFAAGGRLREHFEQHQLAKGRLGWIVCPSAVAVSDVSGSQVASASIVPCARGASEVPAGSVASVSEGPLNVPLVALCDTARKANKAARMAEE